MLTLQTYTGTRLVPGSTVQVYRDMAIVQLYSSITGPIIMLVPHNFNGNDWANLILFWSKKILEAKLEYTEYSAWPIPKTLRGSHNPVLPTQKSQNWEEVQTHCCKPQTTNNKLGETLAQTCYEAGFMACYMVNYIASYMPWYTANILNQEVTLTSKIIDFEDNALALPIFGWVYSWHMSRKGLFSSANYNL